MPNRTKITTPYTMTPSKAEQNPERPPTTKRLRLSIRFPDRFMNVLSFDVIYIPLCNRTLGTHSMPIFPYSTGIWIKYSSFNLGLSRKFTDNYTGNILHFSAIPCLNARRPWGLLLAERAGYSAGMDWPLPRDRLRAVAARNLR